MRKNLQKVIRPIFHKRGNEKKKVLVGETSPSSARHTARVAASHELVRSCVWRHSLPPGASGSGLVSSAASAPSAAPSSPSCGSDG
jgi:hypothetical protein